MPVAKLPRDSDSYHLTCHRSARTANRYALVRGILLHGSERGQGSAVRAVISEQPGGIRLGEAKHRDRAWLPDQNIAEGRQRIDHVAGSLERLDPGLGSLVVGLLHLGSTSLQRHELLVGPPLLVPE